MAVTRVCVYGGARSIENPTYKRRARDLGRLLATKGIGLVYGGISTGLIGVLAKSMRTHGGEVIGVCPRMFVDMALVHNDLTQLIVTDSLHERKALMADMADAFIVLPGGVGTLDELFDTWTASQIGMLQKPIGVLNVAGYYDYLLTFIEHSVHQGFMHPEDRALLLIDRSPSQLLARIERFSEQYILANLPA